jgi:hypothetical protein
MTPNFFRSAYSFDQSVWDLTAGQNLAGLAVDQRIHRQKGYYLESDVRRLWMQWFIEGMIDPHTFLERTPSPVLLDVLNEVDLVLSPTFNVPQNVGWPDIRSAISEALLKKITQIKNGNALRKAFTSSEKSILLATGAPDPRCWICGDKFSFEAIKRFEGDTTYKIHMPTYIDVFRPKGLKERHLKIEIDHVYPISKGGIHDLTNFKLSCGWCNLYKKDLQSLYEVSGKPIRLKTGRITKSTTFRTIPQFFWSVRALGLTQKCEHDGCVANTKNSSLFISLIEPSGAATPSNLSVVCEKHDKFSTERYKLASDISAAIP